MTAEERYKITSEDYADVMVEFNQKTNSFDTFPGATVHVMNERRAIVYVPASQVSPRSINRFGYSAVPSCYGICSEESLAASGITRLRRIPTFNLRGQGVAVGFIDTGIDYTNPIFRRADGTTRILSIWDQTIESERYPENAFYGTLYDAEQINQALQSPDPFAVVPSRDEIGHGTKLAGITAGNEVPESNFSGVVPEADLIVVKLKQAKQVLKDFFVIPSGVPCYQENDLMWAAKYVVDTARALNRPVVICIGLGSSQGSHDGRGALSTLLSVAGDFPGIAITVAAGNEGNKRRHFFAKIDPTVGFSTLELSVSENETGFSMEIWGIAPNTYSIDILSPTGEYIPRIAESLRVNREISFVFERTSIIVDYQMVESSTGDQLILLRFRNPTPGIWRFQVYGRGDLQGSFHSWLPMGDFISLNTFFVLSDPYTTITSPGNALVPITVTAYNTANKNLYPGASRGYSRINTIKPEIAAPGVNITAPTLEQGFAPSTGTSEAAAHTAGIAAMLLEWGIVKGNYPGIDSVEVQKFIIRGADRNPNLTYPNRDWGYGIINVYNIFDVLRMEFS